MILKRVTLDNKSDLEFIEKLYIESFPRHERRSIIHMHQLLGNEERFRMYLLETDDNHRVGFITYWMLGTFIFLDYLAISPEQGNKGYGQKTIELLSKQTNLPLSGEIELPDSSDMATRRVRFYERLGFQIWDLPYVQPPYEGECDFVPMRIITLGDLGFPENYEAIRDAIYLAVYNRKYTNDC